MVGAWCFVDQMGPGEVTSEGERLDVGPHPHIGLQTLTWLVEGSILHRDSLGSEQLIRPGQLNLMTAGRGVSHSEETGGIHVGPLHGVQFWVAQPAATRDGDPAFEHHGDLPRTTVDGAEATVVVGRFGGVESPARRDTEHMGAQLSLPEGRTDVPLEQTQEYAVLPLGPGLVIDGEAVEWGRLAHLGIGRDGISLQTDRPVPVMLIGGEPFPEEILMWWNYVARTRDEIVDAHDAWTKRDPRFGTVASPLDPIDTSPPPFA